MPNRLSKFSIELTSLLFFYSQRNLFGKRFILPLSLTIRQEAKLEKRLDIHLVFKPPKRDFKSNPGFEFFFIPFQFRLDVFGELTNLLKQRYEPILLSPTYEELLSITEKGSPKIRQQVSIALKLTEKCQIVDIEKKDNETHDDVIVRVASKWKCPVATNDSELRKRLRHINVPVIYLRQKSRLEMEGGMH